MNPEYAVCIVHAAHLPERAETFARLNSKLWCGDIPRNMRGLKNEMTRGKWFVWHPLTLDFFFELWEGTKNTSTPITHCLTLQDDVIPCEGFWPKLDALVRARPDDVICLDCAKPAARLLAASGVPGYYSYDNMIGIGHIEPIATVLDFRKWRLDEVRSLALEQVTEDMLFALYCEDRGKNIFAPVPCLLDHDLEIGSTNDGFDNHIYRKPQVTMNDVERFDALQGVDFETPVYWARKAPHVGKFYDNTHELLPLVLKDAERGSDLSRRFGELKNDPAYAKYDLRASAIA